MYGFIYLITLLIIVLLGIISKYVVSCTISIEEDNTDYNTRIKQLQDKLIKNHQCSYCGKPLKKDKNNKCIYCGGQ